MRQGIAFAAVAAVMQGHLTGRLVAVLLVFPSAAVTFCGCTLVPDDRPGRESGSPRGNQRIVRMMLVPATRPMGEDPLGPRYATVDEAALAAAKQIRGFTESLPRRTVGGVEWSYNIFRDGYGFYAAGFYTDGLGSSVKIRINPHAVATGHNHVRPNWAFGAREIHKGELLSRWDLGEKGILRTQERVGRPLPHYLLTPSGKLKVWEWSRQDKEWVVRTVRRSLLRQPRSISARAIRKGASN